MKTKLCDVNPAAKEKLPQFTGDKSGIGAHYVDAYLKPMNVKLEDGTAYWIGLWVRRLGQEPVLEIKLSRKT